LDEGDLGAAAVAEPPAVTAGDLGGAARGRRERCPKVGIVSTTISGERS
jgi:hypothetical protein